MSRELRFVGTTSDYDECPAMYELPNGDYVVQGEVLTDPGEVAQLQKLGLGEGAVVVPRALLTRFAPKV